MSGSGHRRPSKWDLEEVSRDYHHSRDPIGPGSERPSNRESQPRWHSREGNYKVARDSLDDTVLWDGESTMSPGLDDWRQQKRKYSYESSRGISRRSRSRSKSPGHRSERPGVNDRFGRIASFDHRNHEPCRISTVPCKFFASGNCRNGKSCRFSHDDQTRDSFSNYKSNDYRQGVDSRANMSPLREGSKWSGSASHFNLPKHCGNKNESLGEQRVMRSSVGGSAPGDNRLMAHEMDIDEATTNNQSNDLGLTKPSSSVMGASKSRGTALHGVDIEGSTTHTEGHLPDLIGTSRKPDVLDTVKSEATSSNQCVMSTEKFSDLTRSLAQLLGDGKQLPELYAALNASNALGFMQSSVADPDVFPASSSSQYDPVNDSMELIKSVISEQPDGIALQSNLPFTGKPSVDGLNGTHCKDVELNDNSHQSSEKHEFGDCENEEQGVVKAEDKKEGQEGSKLSDNERDDKADGGDKADEKKKNSDGKNLRAFKFSLAEFVKELLKPTWKAGKLNKESHKTIVKKVVDKVTSSVQGSQIPQTQEKIDSYLSASKPKLSKLIQAYVDKVQKENPKVA
ncbi:hypothetical protein DCAR_0101292 [Daucus carota subsp. sativus]|uniref:Uncharacterized protein n=1 Tax=Daucus carota subsp. sativus TaxID=79200 RepID=A0A175Y9P0_DAUCS|nr:PREDICTED: zinc finger CCCH domain-containing protein 38-like [Daucus carota subsp. sativus]WOG82130.1 hypothetical protein DCAR_0101292 [Daucus carota subsp. sativus]